jgi:TonB family protein
MPNGEFENGQFESGKMSRRGYRFMMGKFGWIAAILTAAAAPALAADKSAPAAPANDRSTWVTEADYPPESLAANEQGTTVVQFTVGLDGKVQGCGVKESSGSPRLDYATCQLLTRRAQYTPAKDKKGRPVASTITQRIRWQVPVAPMPSAVPYHLNVRVGG